MAANGLWFLPCSSSSFSICVLTFLLVACVVSSVFRFYLKVILFCIQCAFLSILGAMASLRSPGGANNLFKAAKYLLWTTDIWGIRFNVKGKENLRQDSNYIIVCNHQSSLDVIPMLHVLPPNTRILSKIEVFYTPFIGMTAWLGGVIFLDRQNHSKALDVMKKTVDQVLKEKCNVWVFPEGTRNQGETLLPFKKGAFHLAQQCQVPILPIVFSDYRSIVNFKEKRFLTGTMDITIFPEISTKDLEPSDVNDLTERVRIKMCKEFEQNKPSSKHE